MSGNEYETGSQDGDLARLLATVGGREQASPHAISDVRAAVEAEWREVVAARRKRRAYTGWAVAAGVATAAVAAWLARPLYTSDGEAVASLARVVGGAQVESDGHWSKIGAGGEVRPGDVLQTSGNGRVALLMSDGVQLRLDTGTQLTFNEAHRASLSQGAVYVDSGADPTGGGQFVLSTPSGDVRHLGTQYQARLDGGVLRIGVREGRVEVTGSRGPVMADAGELLSFSDGRVERTALAANARQWTWVGDVTPPFSIEGRSVDEFLAWAARETGRSVVYASPEAERQARAVSLSGTVEELGPDQAVTAVLATTTLEAVVGPDSIQIRSGSD